MSAFAPDSSSGYTFGMCHRARDVLLAVLALCFTATATAEEQKAVKPFAESMLGTEAGQMRDDNGLKMKLVWCPPGFLRGNEPAPEAAGNAEPAAAVNVLVSHGYWIGKYEVTQAQWTALMQTAPWKNQALTKEGDDFPASFVSADDALKFCSTLTDAERAAGRIGSDWEYTLPTHAQWVLACRARTDTRFSFGDDASQLGAYAWYEANASGAGESFAHRVGQKQPNAWGIHDMYGNVAEWCRDYFSPEPVSPARRDPEVTGKDEHRLNLGGAWNSSVAACNHTSRGYFWANKGAELIGFRVVLTPVRPAAETPAK